MVAAMAAALVEGLRSRRNIHLDTFSTLCKRLHEDPLRPPTHQLFRTARPRRESIVTTIRDVARASGVSIATVSRVINDSARVNDDTRRKVWDAAMRLDFWPNGAARTLTTSRTHAIGVLLPELHGEFFSEVIRGIDRAARREKLQLLISSSHADTEGMLAAARTMRGRVDGLIVMSPERGSRGAIEQIRRRFPMVLLNSSEPAADGHSITVANLVGAYQVARHVLAGRHRRVAILKGPPGNLDAQERLRGYRKALKEQRAKIDVEFLDGNFSEESGAAAAERILRSKERPTAIFAANDTMAIGLIAAFQAAGVRVPDDVAVTGFDDILIARYVSPPLTTVRVDACDLGERAVSLLIGPTGSDAAGADRPGDAITLPVNLIVRQSCGRAASAPRTTVRRATERRSQ
jgi:LacI family transcriptional regulator